MSKESFLVLLFFFLLFFFFSFFLFFPFFFFFLETADICLDSTKMEISTGKKAFHAGKKIGKSVLASPPPPLKKYSSCPTVSVHAFNNQLKKLTTGCLTAKLVRVVYSSMSCRDLVW